MKAAGAIAAMVLMAVACGAPTRGPHWGGYTPRARSITVTTVPLLVKEGQLVYPFLKAAFAKGGVLEGKEVYAFSPSTIVVVAGDTIHFTLINPEDDNHSFVLPDFAVALPGGKTIQATYVAKRAGIFTILCSVPTHLPMMSGELVVLPAETMAGVADIGAVSR